MTHQPATLFGPYGTRLEQESKRQGFALRGPRDVVDSSHVRQTLGTIAHEYLDAGARAVTIPCFGTRQLLHAQEGEASYLSALKESLDLVLENLGSLSQGLRRQLSLLFCLGPMNDCYAPELAPDVRESADFHGRQIAAVQEISKTVRAPITLLFETIPSGREAVGIALALRHRQQSRKDLRGIVSYPFTIEGRPLGYDEHFPEIFSRVQRAGSTAIRGQSLNCGPIEGAAKALKDLSRAGHQVLGVYPNASSRPHHELDQSDVHHGLIDREATAAFLRYLGAKHALQFIGGCCGYGHEDVKAIAARQWVSPQLPPTDMQRSLLLQRT